MHELQASSSPNSVEEKVEIPRSTPRREFLRDIGKAALSTTLGLSLIGASDVVISNIRDRANIGHEDDTIFEPGIHSFTESQRDSVWNAVLRGENQHIWNREASKRIYQYQPSVMTIDSFFPKESLMDLMQFKILAWQRMPNRVEELNSGRKIYLVAGDIGLFTSGLGLDADNANYQSMLNYDQDYFRSISSKIIKPVLGVIIGDRLLSIISKEKFSRRKALQSFSGAALIATLTSNSILGILAANSTDMEIKNVLRSINQAMKPPVIKHDLTNGRTAMLIEKQEAVLSFLKSKSLIRGDSKGAVVAGFSHDVESFDFVNNPNKRLKAITVLGEIFVDITRRTAKDFNANTDQTNQAVNAALDNMSKMQIWVATDSGEKFPVSNIQDYVNRNINQFEGDFIDTRIQQALSGLRPT